MIIITDVYNLQILWQGVRLLHALVFNMPKPDDLQYYYYL